MTITLNRSYFESNQSYCRTVDSQIEKQVISPANHGRKSGLIINNSRFDLLVWFGSKIPSKSEDWLVIPSKANCDIPVHFVGEIQGFWRGNDSKNCKIYEFYGD
jgi:hypothetical protein